MLGKKSVKRRLSGAEAVAVGHGAGVRLLLGRLRAAVAAVLLLCAISRLISRVAVHFAPALEQGEGPLNAISCLVTPGNRP